MPLFEFTLRFGIFDGILQKLTKKTSVCLQKFLIKNDARIQELIINGNKLKRGMVYRAIQHG